MKHALPGIALIGASLLLSSCAGTRNLPPLPIVAKVELSRFMGDWYVIANIPTILERGAHNAVENYRLDADGTIATTFTYRKDSFDGEPKRYTPRGFVLDRQTNAIWGMRFIWPVKSDYRIVYLDEAYQTTVVARQKRDYVWIMARTPSIPEAQYSQLLDLLAESGYDTRKIQKVPQRWP
jgi:apolipoprotein D and lipocalin family protein